MEDRDEIARVARQAVLRKRLQDLLESNPQETANDLVGLAVSVLAQQFPRKLKAGDKQAIRENYSRATDALIEERATSTLGLASVLAVLLGAGRMMVDYHPDSSWKRDLHHDDAFKNVFQGQLMPRLRHAFDEAVKAGASPLGTATTMMLVGVKLGLDSGVHWSAMARPLFDASELLLGGVQLSPEALERAAEDLIMQQMGISRATAKQYVKAAKDVKE
ncbi:hypothetical protein [Ralstonia sp. ASV6]|uniref:hypothetical protein n=1 Tax=Ralstonia sp. ASV6 TaxID=2795124 RepID=UPI0018ECCBAF|nr:hypothetical protein [Ralstonia sp. ASV6]